MRWPPPPRCSFEARTSLLQAEGALREPEAPLPPTDGPAASARSKFNEADLNHDRKLDKREFRQLLKKEFGSADPKAADQLFASIDADGSGDIDYAEFKKGVAKGRLGAISVKDFGGGARNGGGDGGSGRRAGAPGGGVPAARGGQSRIPGPTASKRVAGGASDPARSRSASRGRRPPKRPLGEHRRRCSRQRWLGPCHHSAVGYALASGGAAHPAPTWRERPSTRRAMPAAYQQLQPAYHQQMAQQYQQMQQAQLQHALAQQRQQGSSAIRHGAAGVLRGHSTATRGMRTSARAAAECLRATLTLSRDRAQPSRRAGAVSLGTIYVTSARRYCQRLPQRKFGRRRRARVSS